MTDESITERIIQEIEETLWRLQFVGADIVVQTVITTGRMDNDIEVELIIRGVKHR